MQEPQIHTLPNGIRIVHRQVKNSQIAHLGLMLDIGTRDEAPHQQGLAHFWEHMAFKGTERRSSLQIINRLENVGGELNAYTTREKICFYASVLTPHFRKALDLLTDITFHSVFPEKQIEKERQVILEEMAMYYDSPEDAIQDDFDELLFPEHPLGHNILGTTESLSSFTQSDFRQFIDDNLDTSKIVLSSVSRLPFKKIVLEAEALLGSIPERKINRSRLMPGGVKPVVSTLERGLTQAQIAMGLRAMHLEHPDRLPFFMLTNLLGGSGMNARLNLSVREKHGLVYGIEAGFTPYMDTGMMAIYYGTEPKNVEKATSLIHKELKILRENPLTKFQLRTVKQALMGQLAMAEESNLSFMTMMAKSLLDLGRVESLPSIFQQINQVSAGKLNDLAEEFLNEDSFSCLTFMPEKEDDPR